MARMVATKAALSIRVDALADADSKAEPAAPSIGLENRAKLEARLRALEGQADAAVVRSAFTGRGQAKYAPAGEARTYNDKADFVSTQREAAPAPVESAVQAALDVKAEKKRAKEERRAKKRAEKEGRGEAENGDAAADGMEVDGEESKESKKEKKRKRRESEAEAVVEKSKVRPVVWWCGWLCSYRASRMPMRRTRQSGRQRRRRARLRRQLQQPRLRRARQTAVSRQKRSGESLRHSLLSRFISWLYPVIISCHNICISSYVSTRVYILAGELDLSVPRYVSECGEWARVRRRNPLSNDWSPLSAQHLADTAINVGIVFGSSGRYDNDRPQPQISSSQRPVMILCSVLFRSWIDPMDGRPTSPAYTYRDSSNHLRA